MNSILLISLLCNIILLILVLTQRRTAKPELIPIVFGTPEPGEEENYLLPEVVMALYYGEYDTLDDIDAMQKQLLAERQRSA